jgi:hypothetical protein
MEISNVQVGMEYMKQTVTEIHSIHSRGKRAVIPIVGKALSFLLGTLDEADLETIKTNIRIISSVVRFIT